MKTLLPGRFLIFFAILFTIISCKKDTDPGTPVSDEVKTDSIPVIDIKEEPPLVITYHLDSIANMKVLDSLYSSEEQRIIFGLNRIEDVRVGAGSLLLIPDTLFTDILRYSPFPETLQIFDTIPKTVLIAQRIQAFGLYERGKLVKWGPVSSGKKSTPTPNGLHYGNYKAQRKVSTVNKDWILPYYFNFMNFEGVGVHQYLLPGFPASHACVRLDMDDAKYIYDWAKQWQLDPPGNKIVKNGTPFMVFGEYEFEDESPPWMDLARNPEANRLNDAEMQTLKNYVENYLKDEKNYEEPPAEVKELLAGV